MKKITLALCALLIGAMTLVSCGGGSPKEAANAFISAMNKMDIETAKKYSADARKPQLDKIAEQLKAMPADQKKSFDEEVAKRKDVTVTMKDAIVNGDKATVTFITSDAPEHLDSLQMVKQNGKWVADLDLGL
jgi:hypothetical protein